MEKMSKFILILLALSVVFLIVTVSLILYNKSNEVKENNQQAAMFTYNDNDNDVWISSNKNIEENILFEFSFENHSWQPKNYGYKIYLNGTIEGYDKYDESKNKSATITNDELQQLKKYADTIEDSYQSNNDRNYDAGSAIYQVYNSKLGKWIIVKKGGVVTGTNDSDVSDKLVEFADSLYNKYLE